MYPHSPLYARLEKNEGNLHLKEFGRTEMLIELGGCRDSVATKFQNLSRRM